MSAPPPVQHYTHIIIGAGPQGLAAANTVVSLSPSATLLILDAHTSVGGVWAKENLYPGLKTNNIIGADGYGTFEFPDLPLKESGVEGWEPGGHLRGEVVQAYFDYVCREWRLKEKLRLGWKVVRCEHLSGKEGSGWEVTAGKFTGNGEAEEMMVARCEKLVVATGLTNAPMPISLPGASTFTAPLCSFGDWRQRAAELLRDEKVKHVAVYGGSKSAYDAVYALATAAPPKKITWVIRTSGHGPVYMAPAHIYLGPVRCWLEKLVTTRFFTFFSPCIWGTRDGFPTVRKFLHRTSFGRAVVMGFWGKLSSETIAQSGLLSKGEEVEKLVPHQNAIWYGSGTSILNYERDIHRFVRDGTVDIVRKDIESLEKGNRVKFADGEEMEVDALVCSTGWRWDCGIEFLPKEEHSGLGIPSADLTRSQMAEWEDLEGKADAEILEKFPALASSPGPAKNIRVVQETEKTGDDEPERQVKAEYTPWRLFRGMAPPNNPRHDVVFLGMMMSLQTMIRSDIAALWGYAYLEGQLGAVQFLSDFSSSKILPPLAPSSPQKKPHHLNGTATNGNVTNGTVTNGSLSKNCCTMASSEEKQYMYDTALFSRFGRWRYPLGYGARFPDFVFDGLPYLDMLLQDLGLNSWRKGWGWFGELFWGGSYDQKDYVGLKEEWKRSKEI